MPPPGHGDESESNDEVLVKRMKQTKQAIKSRPKKMQVRSKKCAKANTKKKKEDVQKSTKPPVKRAQLSLCKHQTEHKSLKKDTSATISVKGPKFDPYSVTLYISPDKRIEITPMDVMDVHLTLALPISGKKVEEFYGKKPKDAKYNEVLGAWRKDWNLQDGTPK
ncbi:hypothetical protein Cgig2_027720 [Carnegiea gigantea]|uniref:Uncharacterized protein n=1 Tax=Carnegiea gigantea TaxID=171969 RepID=A0A9Q1GS90_9CARY|nr:hypothetical protein Cgig2_027720 [Carnegiea gigantea]